jgi:excinuclease ABC subunit C
MTSFIKQFYSTTPYVPPLILIQYPVEDQEVIEGWLQGRRGSRVSLRVPSRGSKRQLMAMVVENARQGLQQLKFKQLAAPAAIAQALGEIARELGLPGRPQRLEGYDISNIQGKAAVGSMVVFDQGRPRPSLYRRFRIKMVSGADDYAMLREVLQRRFQRTTPQSGEAVSAGGWGILPDLVLVDGGRGQLNAALLTMGELGIDTVPVASLAKENEEVFIPHKKAPIVLPPSSPGLQLLQRLRDEAHRFALGYHQRIRHRETFVSVLDAIPGIGPKRKRALFKQFGSVSAIQQAPLTQLAAVTGMNQRLAKLIKESL